MILQFARAVFAFFVFSFIGFKTFGNYQKAEEIELASRTAFFLGLIAAANSIFVPPSPWKLKNIREKPGYLYTAFQLVASTIFSFYIVFTQEPAYAIIPISISLNSVASNSKYYEDNAPGMVLAVILLSLAAMFIYDTSSTSADLADGLRDLYGFKEVKDSQVEKATYLTGPDTLFVDPVITSILVLVFSSSLLFFKKQISYPSRAKLEVVLNPEKDGIENLARFIGEMRK